MGIFRTHDGTELAYDLQGEGEPLICLPGGPMRAAAYLGDLGGLGAHRRLVLLHPRGTGDSAVPADPAGYRRDRQADDVEALREHLGLDRVDLLGHSAGAGPALYYATRHPGCVRSLTLVTPDTSAVGIPATPDDRREAALLRSAEPWYEAGIAALDALGNGQESPEIWDAVRPFTYGRWDEAARAHVAARESQFNFGAIEHFYADGAPGPATVRAALAGVQAPVLVLAGELDGGPRPARAAELAALFPDGRCVVQAGAAHFPWLDDPGAFTRAVAAFLDPDVRSVQAGGVRLAYRVWGHEDAPPVVLAHGRCGNSDHWTHVAERLAATRRVYAGDLRGHGLSEWPGSYGFAAFRDDLAAFVTALGLGPVDLVGHSMGGAAALLLAEERPELVRRLVVEEPPPLQPLDPPRPPAVRPEGPLDFDWPLVPATDAELNEPDPDWWDRLTEIKAETLVIAGGPSSGIAQDRIAALAARIPGARLVTVEAGHLVHETEPEKFLAALQNFGI
ncbi:alpha/beta fold hydrolase [Streptomyces sp. NPDC002867]